MSSSEPVSSWSVLLFGTVTVTSPLGEQVVFPGRYSEALFAALCLSPGVPLDRDVLAERFWPSLELPNKRTRLRQELLTLRRLVGVESEGGLLVQGRSTVAVVADRMETDLAQFLQYTRQGDTESLRNAVALYRGELLEQHESLANGKHREVAELYEGALAALAARERAGGHYEEARALLQKLLERDSLNLAAHSELMRLYAQQGQPGGVHRQWQQAQTSWQETLGAAPPEALGALARELQHTSVPPPALSSSLPAQKASPLQAQLAPTVEIATPRRSHRSPLWLLPLGLLSLGLWAWWHQAPAPIISEAARLKWHYEDPPELPEEKPNSEAMAVATIPTLGKNGLYCVTGLVETQHEDVDVLTLIVQGDGTLLHRLRYSGPGHDCDRAYAVIADNDNNFMVVGESYLPETPGQREGWRLLVLKYTAAGNLLWARTGSERAKNEERQIAVALDGKGGVYVAGTALVGEKNAEKRHPLLEHYTAEGTLLWSRTLVTQGSEATFGGLCTDPEGNAYLAATVMRPGGSSDWLVASYSASGELRWRQSVDGPQHGEDRVGGVVLSPTQAVFVGGTQQFGPNQYALALARFTPSGSLLGVSHNTQVQPDIQRTSMALSDKGSRIALAGRFTRNDNSVAYELAVFDGVGSFRWQNKLVAPAPYKSLSDPRILVAGDGAVTVAAHLSHNLADQLHLDSSLQLSLFRPDGQLTSVQHSVSPEQAVDTVNALIPTQDSERSPLLVGRRIARDRTRTSAQLLCLDMSKVP